MNDVIAILTRLYAKLLRLYPARFRDEFAAEMQSVFRDSLQDASQDGIIPFAVFCLRELRGMSVSILREIWHETQGKELMMLHETVSNSPATSRQVMMGALPFFVFGLIMIMFELPDELFMTEWFAALGSVLFAALLLLPAIGFGLGWVQNFPRWSYPYVGMALVLAFYMQNASTPGLNFFGVPIFGRELWGWRAWIPLVTAFVFALTIRRSFKPFITFFTNLWKDWSIPTYFMVGALPGLVSVAFDEIDRLYSLYFMVAFAVLLLGMVILYLRSKYTWQRVIVLTLGILTIIFLAVWGTNSYWLNNDGIYPSGVRRMWILAGKIAIIMLLPAWLELFRRFAGRLRPA